MKANDYHRIGNHTCRLFSERWKGHDRTVLRYTLLSMLRNGKVAPELIARKFGVTLPRIAAEFGTSRYDLDNKGNVADVFGVNVDGGRPFTLTTGNTTLHICCALVSLMVSQLTADAKTISSADPISSKEITVIASQTVLDATPVDAVAVLVAPPIDDFCADQWNAFCKYVRFYESIETANAGLLVAPSAISLPISELMKIAALLSRQLWADY